MQSSTQISLEKYGITVPSILRNATVAELVEDAIRPECLPSHRLVAGLVSEAGGLYVRQSLGMADKLPRNRIGENVDV